MYKPHRVGGSTTKWRALGILATALGYSAGCAGRGDRQDPADKSASPRVAVLEQARTELSLWSGAEALDTSQLRVEKGPALLSGIRVERIWLPTDHSHPYLVARTSTGLHHLGGFETVELKPLAAALAPQRVTRENIHLVARELALVSDHNGATRYFFPADTAQASNEVRAVASSWFAQDSGRAWPPELVSQDGQGTWRVQTTLLSQAVRSYTQDWTPVAYSFLFDRQGRLIAWSTRRGGSFVARSSDGSLLP